MKVASLSEEIKNLDKKDFSIKEKKTKSKSSPAQTLKQRENNICSTNLPMVRKVALAKRHARIVLLVALFVSCFSLSVFIGFIGPFLLFK